MLTTIAGILGVAAVSHLTGHAIAGGLLARVGVLGFGGRAAQALKLGKSVQRVLEQASGKAQQEAARQEFIDWVNRHTGQSTGQGEAE